MHLSAARGLLMGWHAASTTARGLSRECPGRDNWTGIHMAGQHERGGGGDMQGRLARRGDRRGLAVNGVSMRPRVEVSPADTCPHRYQGAPDAQLRQTAWLRQRCDGHRMRVFARQRCVYRAVARHWQPGAGVPNGGRRDDLPPLLLWVCHHDPARARSIIELWLYLV